VAVSAFFDTSVLIAGHIDFGPQSRPAQQIMDLVAARPTSKVSTAWHCCLEFYSVVTRLPPEYRLTPVDAVRLLEEEILARLTVHDLPASNWLPFFKAAARDGLAGGRIYDAHIAEVARAAGAEVVITDNRRHFLAALRHGLRVETPEEFLASVGKRSERG
jgi:predicted nucleic acid-binding protein